MTSMRAKLAIAAVLAVAVAAGGSVVTEGVGLPNVWAGLAAATIRTPIALGQGAAADGPSFLIRMHRRDGTDAGVLVIEGLDHGNGDSLTRTDRAPRGAFLLLRPGVCFEIVPPPHRSVHPYQGTEGQLPIGFRTLQRSAFAVEIVSGDGLVVACGDHAGTVSTAPHSWASRSIGRAQWRSGMLRFSSPAVGVTLKPFLNGRRTQVSARTDAGGSNGVFAHLRAGSCRKVARGREWPMFMPTNDSEAGTAHVTAVLAIPFAQVRHKRFAFEVHEDVIGVEVAYCVDLH
ncbi:MAG TPA: hypothetical protein VH620_11835 [Gaiella sp.]